MRNHRITDDEAAALLRGRTPHARRELSPLAAAVSEFRGSSLGTPPRPSAAVAPRLDLDRVSTIVALPPENPDMTASLPLTAARSARRSRVALEWFAGLGLAAKIAIGATAISSRAGSLTSTRGTSSRAVSSAAVNTTKIITATIAVELVIHATCVDAVSTAGFFDRVVDRIVDFDCAARFARGAFFVLFTRTDTSPRLSVDLRYG